jgi:hypothetical protein
MVVAISPIRDGCRHASKEKQRARNREAEHRRGFRVEDEFHRHPPHGHPVPRIGKQVPLNHVTVPLRSQEMPRIYPPAVLLK